MKIILLVGLLVLTSLVDAAPVTFQQAKALADQNEAALSADQLQRLTLAQGALGAAAFSRCAEAQREGDNSPFIVIMELNGDGKIARTWLKGTSKVAICFNNQLLGKSLFTPPISPFYTSFSMKFTATKKTRK